MLRAILICPDQLAGEQLEKLINGIGVVSIARFINHYPNEINLLRAVRAIGPQIVFLSVRSMERALEVAATIEANMPGLYIIALGPKRDPQILEALIRTEIRDFLKFPPDRSNLVDAIARARERLAKKPPAIKSTDLLFSFLPSKAGVGTSTIALNVGVALSKMPDTPTLLSDFDLNSGMIHFMLKLEHVHSVIDAVRRVDELDEYIWQDLVSNHQQLDVLHSGDFNPDFRVDVSQVRALLDFARRHYRAICLDLSGNMEQYSLEIMRESKRIFLVSTPEINSLHLARKKCGFLKSQDLGDRLSLVLNRVDKYPALSSDEIKELVGLPSVMTLPNDYEEVQAALTAGRPVSSQSALGKQCAELACRLVEDNYQPAAVKSGLAEFVSGHMTWTRRLLSRG